MHEKPSRYCIIGTASVIMINEVPSSSTSILETDNIPEESIVEDDVTLYGSMKNTIFFYKETNFFVIQAIQQELMAICKF